MKNNLITLDDLSKEEIIDVINLAADFENDKALSSCFGKHLALFFFEDSTRTKFSFEMAANKLGVHIYNFEAGNYALSKGELLKDAIENLYQIGINGIVIRHSESGIIRQVAEEVRCPISFINAGDGQNSHPTQALLDFYTMHKHLKDLEGKKITFVGDVKHSRVAHSNIKLLKKFNANICICTPKYFKDEIPGVNYTNKLEDALKDADVAMFLRIQKERLEDRFPIFDYVHDYGLTMKKLREYASEKILIMHPGPVNRDVELSSEILDSEWGNVILEQSKNGVFVRMAVLDMILGQK